MDSLCLFEPTTLLLRAVNAAWVRRFGFSKQEVTRIAVTALTPSPSDILGALAGSRPAPLVGRARFRIDLVFAIALAKDPEARFLEVEPFATALRDAAEGRLDEATRVAGDRLLGRPQRAASR